MHSKRNLSILLAAILMVATLASPLKADAWPTSSWAQPEVEEAIQMGLMPVNFLFYDMTAPITRVDYCAIIIRAYPLLVETPIQRDYWATPFDDTFNDDVNYANQLGIVNGVGNRLFKPDQQITRYEIAQLFYNMLGAVGRGVKLTDAEITSTLSRYTDAASIPTWARKAVAGVTKTKLMNGKNGVFSGSDRSTYEEAFIMARRLVSTSTYRNANPAVPAIVSPAGGDVGNKGFTIKWDYYDIAGTEFTIHCYNVRDPRLSITRNTYGNNYYKFYAEELQPGDTYVIAISADGCISIPITCKTGPQVPLINASFANGANDDSSFYLDGNNLNKPVKLSWSAVTGATSYRVSVTMERQSTRPENIPDPVPTIVTTSKREYTIPEARPLKNYYVKVAALNSSNKVISERSLTMITGGVMPMSAKRAIVFYNGPDTTQATMRAEAKTVTCPVWKVDASGKKYASKVYITVNKMLAQQTLDIFTEIYNGAEKFPIYTAGGVRDNRGEHGNGSAIDINPDENYCIYTSGEIVGKYWKPGVDKYSILPYGDVITAFERRESSTVVTLGGLDFDDLSSHVRHEHGSKRSGQDSAQIKNANAV